MNKINLSKISFYVILALIVVVVGLIAKSLLWPYKADAPSGDEQPIDLTPMEVAYEGSIVFLMPAKIKIEVVPGQEEDVNVSSDTLFFDINGATSTYGSLMLGLKVRVSGVKTGDVQKAGEIRIIGEPNIIVYAPKANDILNFPAEILGSARVFENQLNYRVKDADGSLLVEGNVMANSPDTGLYGSFYISAKYLQPKALNGTVEVFDYSAKDGTEIDKVIIPVTFAKTATIEVSAFFPNTIKDPNMPDCSKAYAVTRRILSTPAPAMAALNELLLGPSNMEAGQGYITSINQGVTVQSLSIENEIAKVDFSEELQKDVAGSCKVTSITSQIVQTLKQFDTVKKVIISINGKTEGILQP